LKLENCGTGLYKTQYLAAVSYRCFAMQK